MVEWVDDLKTAVEPYVDLLNAFIDGQLSAADFETAFDDRYLHSTRRHTPDVFDVMDGFFADVDAYVDEPELREPEQGDLGPDELRAKAISLLERAGLR